MCKKLTRLFFMLMLFSCPLKMLAQQNHLQVVQKRLDSLSKIIPGLNQKVQVQVVGISIQAYLAGIASSNGLNISIDSKLNVVINDSFPDVTASNVLFFLAQKYNLDITSIGSIIYVTAYQDPALLTRALPKDINVKYNLADNTLSLALDNDSLVAVAKKITQVSGKNVLVPNGLQGKIVHGFIAVAPFETALDKMAFANEIKMIKTSDNFYLFQPLGDNEELYINGEKSTSVRRTFRPNPPAATGGIQLFSRSVNGQKLISVEAVNAPIVNLVKLASQELAKNYSIYTDLKGIIDIHVNDVTYDNFLSLLFRGTNYTFQAENGIYLIGDRTIEGLRTSRAVHLQNRSLDTIMSMIPADWKKGIEIKEFREQNTLLLSGSIAQINEVEKFINQLDVLVPVVLIEVTMIDFHKTRTIATGISAGVADSTKTTGGTLLPGVNFTLSASSVNSFLNSLGSYTSLNLGHVVPNFYASIQALETNNNVDVRSIPKLAAMNGHTATLSIGSRVYYKTTTQNLYPSASNTTSVFNNLYTPVEADLSVDIKPIVSGDDQVTLGIKVNISDFTNIPSDGSPPPQAISKFETSLRVHSEDTILLGGIERTENSLTASGTPILSRIPIIKWLFSSRTKTNSKVTTVLFIKSTILR